MTAHRQNQGRGATAVGMVGALLAACGGALASVPLSTVQVGQAALFWSLAVMVLSGASAAVLCAARRSEPFHPYAIVAVIALVLFGGRFVYLGIESADLVGQNFRSSFDPVDSLLELRSQEISLFVDHRLIEPWQQALTRAMAALALFFAVFTVGYRVAWGRRLARRLARVGDRDDLDMRVVIPLWLGVGLAAQAVVLVKAGGIGSAAQNILTQTNFDAGLVVLVLASFAPIGLLIWACWHWPTRPRERIAFALAIGETLAFYAILGSRSLILAVLVLLLIARHFRVRQWRARAIVASFAVALVFFTAYLAVRQASYDVPLSAAFTRAPAYLVDPRGILNDTTAFDDIVYVTSLVPNALPFRHGGALGDGVRAFVPSFIDPDRPEPFEVQLRYLVAGGGESGGGRPPTIVGELWREDGFLTIALGALLLGILARGLSGLVSGRRETPGAPLRVAFYAIGLVMLLELMIGSWSIVIGFALYLLVPLALALALAHRSGQRTQ